MVPKVNQYRNGFLTTLVNIAKIVNKVKIVNIVSKVLTIKNGKWSLSTASLLTIEEKTIQKIIVLLRWSHGLSGQRDTRLPRPAHPCKQEKIHGVQGGKADSRFITLTNYVQSWPNPMPDFWSNYIYLNNYIYVDSFPVSLLN